MKRQLSVCLIALWISVLASSVCWGASNLATFLSVPNRTDMVFDSDNSVLYITAGTDVERYSLASHQFLSPIALGGGSANLSGIDVSPNGSEIAVADLTESSTNNWIYRINTSTNAVTQDTFPLAFSEGGTYMPQYTAAGKILVSSTFNGSGWVPLREFDPTTNTTTVLASSVRQDTMLTASADRQTIGMVQANISSGPVGAFYASSGTLNPEAADDGWFNFEIGTSRDGSQFAVPTYDGMFVYNSAFQQVGTIGSYASQGPIGVVYSPNSDVIYTSWYSYSTQSRSIMEFNEQTLQPIGSVDAFGSDSGSFGWTGNGALGDGRLKISPDGHTLFATVPGGVSIISVPEPAASLLMFSCLFASCVRRRRQALGASSSTMHSLISSSSSR
jgi:hypothetical protein